jgi:hypothetical protein
VPESGTRHFTNITRSKIDLMFTVLTSHGAAITGSNPWDIDTHKHGVILRAEWNEAASTLALSVAGRSWYVSSAMVWDQIDPLLRTVQERETA